MTTSGEKGGHERCNSIYPFRYCSNLTFPVGKAKLIKLEEKFWTGQAGTCQSEMAISILQVRRLNLVCFNLFYLIVKVDNSFQPNYCAGALKFS
jgi:hypothetical protein